MLSFVIDLEGRHTCLMLGYLNKTIDIIISV